MIPRSIEEILLANFSLEEILELNDISEEEVIEILYENGWLTEPENIIRAFDENGEELNEAND